MIEGSLLNKLKLHQKQQDPAYQAQLDATKTSTAGNQQTIDQRNITNPQVVESNRLRNVGAERNIERSKIMDPLDVKAAELGNKLKEAQIGYEKSGVKGSNRMMVLQDKLNRQEGEMSPAMLKEAKNVAAADGFIIEKADATNYTAYPKKSADGRRYREFNDRKIYATPKYSYQLRRKSEAEPSRESFGLGGGTQGEQLPSGGEVVLQDESGQVIGTMPDLPDRTYVEIDGKTFTIPNDQLNDFRAEYPKASVYQIHKK
jgi:hypothetical protein